MTENFGVTVVGAAGGAGLAGTYIREKARKPSLNSPPP